MVLGLETCRDLSMDTSSGESALIIVAPTLRINGLSLS